MTISSFDYLIVGGGMVADSAARGIREKDTDGTIGILGADVDEPYTRPALSKKLWTDDEFTTDKVPLNTASDTGATVLTETAVSSIDRANSTVTTASGDTYGYTNLLLATGATPKTLDLPATPRVVYFRTYADYRRLRELATEGSHIAVVGGGYIGAEIASALVQNKVKVTLVTSDDTLGAHMFPADLASAFDQGFVDHGVTVTRSAKVTGGSQSESSVTVTLDDGTSIEADAVVFGLGVTPNTDLAENAGLDVDNGIVVDEFLRTSDEHIYAAGDVANYPDAILGRRRIEHVDNAEQMGKTVGQIMAGSTDPYTYTPLFYSDVFDDGYQAIGTLDASLTTVEDWKEPAKEGVVYYLNDEKRVQGVLMWNVWEGLDEARELLADTTAQTEDSLRGTI
ncbi:NAD(P)/FAD-dependent oxidoreductase [Actinomycetes bacterium M1A6_2h]